MDWNCRHTWKQSAINTAWCLFGCCLGDFGTILVFQHTHLSWPTLHIMILATINGLLTSIILETIILTRSKQMPYLEAIKVAMGMSFISMSAMEITMNTTDFLLTGGATLQWWALPIILTLGFITPWPYNYWRLKRYGKSCH
jgi:hypothetical protein